MSPLVSIIMPTFRRGNTGYLERAVDSVRMQSFTNFEFIIIDDGSIDSTQKILQSYTDSRIRIIRHETNSGIHAKRLNEGIRLASGQYIAFMFDDDFWLPFHLEMMVANLEDLPLNYGGVFGVTMCMNSRTKKIELLGFNYSPEKLKEGNCIGNQAVLIRKEVLLKVGGYDEHPGIIRLCDWDLWLRIINAGYQLYKVPIVSTINEYDLADSIRQTVPLDMNFIYKRISEERGEYLRDLIWPGDGQLVKGDQERAVYLIRNGSRYLIPSIEVFNQYQFSWDNVRILPQAQVNSLPNGGVFQG